MLDCHCRLSPAPAEETHRTERGEEKRGSGWDAPAKKVERNSAVRPVNACRAAAHRGAFRAKCLNIRVDVHCVNVINAGQVRFGAFGTRTAVAIVGEFVSYACIGVNRRPDRHVILIQRLQAHRLNTRRHVHAAALDP